MTAECDTAFGRRRAGRGPFAMPAQHRVNARDELARVERLRQVIVGAHLEADDAIDFLAFRRQHDDRHRFAGAAQSAADGQPVLARQHQVEHDQVRRVALQLAVELRRIGEGRDLEALLGQVARQQVAQAHVVVDDEDLWGGCFVHARLERWLRNRRRRM